jgi:hypothetical protein
MVILKEFSGGNVVLVDTRAFHLLSTDSLMRLPTFVISSVAKVRTQSVLSTLARPTVNLESF